MVLFQAAFNFGDTVNYLVESGVYDVLLPFLLIFSIIFAILEKTKILGESKTNINVVVSVVIGLLLIVQRGIVEIINILEGVNSECSLKNYCKTSYKNSIYPNDNCDSTPWENSKNVDLCYFGALWKIWFADKL